MPTASLTGSLDAPFTRDQLAALATAKENSKKIHSAAKVASFNGWSFGAAAIFSALFALWSTASLLLSLGLAIVSFNEFRGRQRLLQFDPLAARSLGWNQLFLLAMVVGYSAWMLYAGLIGDSSFAVQMEAQPELREALGSLDDLEGIYDGVVVVLYGTVIVASILYQGLNALYYFTRGKYIADYVAATPDWALGVLRD